MAKGRLAPLKPTTIPRLELRAAVLAVELSLIIKAELQIPITAVEYHSDSQIVLHQLHSSNAKQPRFVNKRKEKILRHSTVRNWHFIPSAENPADDSRNSAQGFRDSLSLGFWLPSAEQPSLCTTAVHISHDPNGGRRRSDASYQRLSTESHAAKMPSVFLPSS
jgi:hypothetical protein